LEKIRGSSEVHRLKTRKAAGGFNSFTMSKSKKL